MADKDYNVRLNVQTQEAVQNIDSILRRLTDVHNAITDMSDEEIGINVVVRNAGFQHMIASVNKHLIKLQKDVETTGGELGTKLGDGISSGLDKAGKKTGRNNTFKQATKEIAAQVKSELEGSLSGLEKSVKDSQAKIKGSLNSAFESVGSTLEETIANSVTKGMAKGLRGLTHGAQEHFNNLNLTFRNNFNELDDGLSNIKDLAKHMDELVAGIRKVTEELSNLTGSDKRALYDQAMGMARNIAKTSAHDRWSEDHMSLKDRAHYDVENRRLDQQDQVIALSKIVTLYQEEIEKQKAANAEKREDIRLTKEQERADKKLKAAIKVYDKQGKHEDLEIERSKLKLQAEQRKTLDQIKQTKDQTAQLEKYANENAQRMRIQDTELEKQFLRLRQASLRVKQQEASTARGLHVDESAIAKAAQEKRDAEIRTTQEILRQVQGYDRIKESSKETVKRLNDAANSLQRWSSAVSSLGGIFSSFRSMSTSLANTMTKTGSMFLGYARQAASSIANAAGEQYRQLELAQIGFTNFYGADQASDLIKQIKDQAMISPGVDAGDLASFVRQLAPVSEGNSQQALDAAMGMLKTIQYGGGEASEEMEYVIKNIRDVISKGTATTIDRRQFSRAMPIMEDVLESIGKSDFIKDGQLKIDKNNAKDLLQAFADINNDPSSPVKDIFEQMSNTLSGITDVIRQTFITKLNDTLIDMGFYDKVKTILKDLSKSGAIEKFYTFIADAATKILDFASSLDWGKISKASVEGAKGIWQSIKDVANDIMKTLGASDLPALISKVMGLISNFIRGFGDGINKIFQLVNWLNEKLGGEGLNKIAGAMGLLASPFGSIAQKGMGIAANALGFSSRVTYNVATKYQEKVERKLNSIDGWVKQIATTGKFMAGPSNAANNGVVTQATLQQSLDPSKVTTGGKMAKNSFWIWNKAEDQIASMRKDGSWYSAGGLNNFYGLSGYRPNKKDAEAYNNRNRLTKFKDYVGGKKQQWSALGDGSMFKGAYRDASVTIRSTVEKLKPAVGKMVRSFAYYEIGNGISSLASEFARNATGSEYIGDVTKGLGDTAAAAIAVGSQFGPLPGLLAGFIESIKSVSEAATELADTYKEEQKTKLETMYGQTVNDVWFKVLDGLKEQGLFKEYDDTSQTSKDATLDFLYEKVRTGVTDVNELFEGAKKTYLTTRAGIRAAGKFNEDVPGIKKSLTTTTRLDPNAGDNLMKLKAIYEKGVEMGWWGTAMAADEEGNLKADEYQNYLEKQGFDINSQEFLDKLYVEVNGLADTFAKEVSVQVPLHLTDKEGNELDDANAWAAAQGWDVVDGKWYRNAEVYISYKESQDGTKTGNFSRALRADGEYSFVDALAESADRMIGAGNPFLPWARDGWFNFNAWFKQNGGFVKPIYRASGSEVPTRGVDTVPVMAQPGEYVMRKSAVNKFGAGVFNALNVGDLGKAAQLLGARFTGNWNNSRSYSHNTSTINKYVTNKVSVFNRTRSGTVNSYNSLANRLAMGF